MAAEKQAMEALEKGAYEEAFRLLEAVPFAERTAREHYLLYYCYSTGVGTKPDYNKAAAEILEFDGEDDPLTVVETYVSAREGIGSAEEDVLVSRMEEPLEKERKEGNPFAARALGLLRENGIGGPCSAEKAEALYREAMEMGFAPAAYDAALLYTRPEFRDREKLEYWAEKGAEAGYVKSMVLAGDVYFYKGMGESDPEKGAEPLRKAAYWYERAADGGDDSQLLRAANLEKAHPQWGTDPEKVFSLLRRGMEVSRDPEDTAMGEFSLGECFREGFGTEKDPAEALKRYRKAEEKGVDIAGVTAAKIWYEGGMGRRNEKRAFSQLKRAAKNGNGPAMYFLGRFFAEGIGTAKDAEKAAFWLRKAVGAECLCCFADGDEGAEAAGLGRTPRKSLSKHMKNDGVFPGREISFPEGPLGDRLSLKEASDWLEGEAARTAEYIRKEIAREE